MEIKIKKVEFQYQNIPSKRRIKVTFNDGEKAYIESCYESWQQYGATEEHLWESLPIAEKYNDWLHGEGNI